MKRLHRVAARLLRWNRVACVLLILCLLSSSTPAAPKTIVSFAKESRVSFAFWFHSSGLAKLIQGRGSNHRAQERQRDRDAKIARIEIFPKNAAIDLDDYVRFAAIAYDANGNPLGGTKIKWSGENLSGQRVRISKEGEFKGTSVGTFSVIAEANGKTARIAVTVRPSVRRNLNLPPLRTRSVSTRDVPNVRVASTAQSRPSDVVARLSNNKRRNNRVEPRRAHARELAKSVSEATAMLLDDGWNDTNYVSADDPGNRVGDSPGNPIDGGAGSGNFQFAAPIHSSPGRGINLSLGAAYNARVWNKAGAQITYDIDRSWPAPGFNVGFGKILYMGPNSGSMLVDADGTRHSYTGTITDYGYGTLFIGHTTDGTMIDYQSWTLPSGVTTFGEVNLPNGTQLHCYAPGPGGVYPTDITDPNGNYITITYVNNTGPRIQAITDTLGRIISFHYDANALLTAITVPGLNGGTREAVRFHYRQLALNAGFHGLTPVARDWNPWVVDAIYYPGTNTGYWFGDVDSYSTYGMLAKVVEQRGMGFYAASLNEQGEVTQGAVMRRGSYNYPLNPDYSLTDAPTYTSMTEEWTSDGTNFESATTGYEVFQNTTPRTTIITSPNGIKSKQYSYNYENLPNSDPLKALDGLVYRDVTYVSDENSPLQSSTSTWEKGSYDSPRPLRVEKTDERGQTTAAEFSYGPVYNQVTEVRDYGYGGSALLRATRTTYQNSADYTGSCSSTDCIGRHIFNLPLTVEVFDANNVRVSRTEYQYDGQTLTNRPDVVQFMRIFDPYAEQNGFCTSEPDWTDPDCTGNCYEYYYYCDGYCPQITSCPYNPITAYRGNVTQVTSYADALNLTGAVTETRRYDITGNLVTASSSCCEETSLNYTVETQYAYPESQTRGSATDAYKQISSSATYDFNTGLTLSATDANGRVSQTAYHAATMRPASAISPTGAHTDYAYDDVGMTASATTYLGAGVNGPIADQSIKLLNGNGMVRQEKAKGPNNSQNETWDAVDTVFDNLGQVVQQSRPYRVGGASPIFSTATYDVLGRTKTVTAPDGSITETFYNEAARPDVASSEPGETTRVRDPWGRERWGRTDASGRLVEVVEPNPNGDGSVVTGGLVTKYVYNTLGKLITINSMSGAQVEQTRSFKYDSLGRLIAQKLAETSATIDDSGAYVGGGGPGAQWGDYFRYENAHSNLVQRLDARGVKTNYWYFNPEGHTDPGDGTSPDPLNRLQSVSWDTTIANQNLQPTDPNYVLSAASVTYQYRTKNSPSDSIDITQLINVSAASVSTESYGYDAEGRVSSKTLTLTSRSSFPFATNYNYDSLDRVTDVLYPKQYGNGSASRKLVHHDYDIASRLSGLTYDGQSFASNIVYNAASQTTALNVGTGANQITETYGYNAQIGLLDNQRIARGATTLLDLSYEYANASGKRTGQLTNVLNNLNHNKDRGYSYDALGRLVQATGGINGALWSQTYSYDRYGNRTNVTATGYSAKVEKPAEPKPSLPTDLVAKKTKIELPQALREIDGEPISDTTVPLYSSNDRTFSINSRSLSSSPAPQSGPAPIAYASNRDGSAQIYLMNSDGSSQTRLTNNSSNDDAPRWSPNNSKMVFQSDRDSAACGIFDIYSMNADGSGQTRLTFDANDDSAPVWSPDGSKIAFQSFRNGVNYQVYVMNADGSGQANITNSGFNDTQPSWSPDGTKIAFSSDRDHPGLPTVYVMNANGSGQTRLTFTATPFRDEQPTWSRDGAKIAFVSTRDSVVENWTETDDFEIPEDDGQIFPKSRLNINKEVYVMNPDGSGQTRLTSTLENDETPSWSGDGAKIVFHSERERECCDPISQVWVMNPDGTGQTNLSNNQSGDFSPSWRNAGGGGPPVNSAQFISQSAPQTMTTGQSYAVWVRMKNTGTTTWTSSCNYNLGSQNPQDNNTWGLGRVTLPATVAPGQEVTFNFTVTAPSTPGTYNFQWRMVQDGVEWFGDYSTTLPISANGTNGAPTVNLTGPANGTSFTAPASINITANASDSDGTVSSVEFYQSTTLLGTDTTAPYSFSWNNVAVGSYSLTARATDNGGSTTTSTAVSISVNADQPPTVIITGPANGATFTAPASVSITANAGDSDGTVSSVQFYQGTTLIGTDTSAPYTLSWNNVAAGSYSLTAKATDNAGGTTTSEPVSIVVNAAPVPIPLDGHASLAHDTASNRITTSGFAYDAAGNQVRALVPGSTTVSQRFQYDAANRLVKVKADDNQTGLANYTYGDDNQRLIVEESGVRTYYVAGGLSVIAEYFESGGSVNPAWSKSYVYLGNRLLSMLTPNGSGGEAVEYHHPDRLGTRLVTNPATGGSFEQVALPFGTAFGAESTGATTRRFTSYERSDTTKLDYAVNRHYDAQQGRFTQVDPIGMGDSDLIAPQTFNLYSYCTNDPINQVDPDGLGLISFFKKVLRIFSKVVKILKIAAMVALAILTFIPGSPLGAIAGWLWFKVFTPLSGLLGLQQTQAQNYPGSPPWNPNSRRGGWGGFGFQDGPQWTPQSPDDIIRIDTWAKGPWWDKVFGAVKRGLNIIAGIGDQAIFWLPWFRRAIGDNITDVNSSEYKWSGRVTLAATFFIPGTAQVKGAGLAARFARGKWLVHFEKHGGEFGFKTSVEYLQGARSLIGRSGVQTFIRANGDRLFYDVARNEFAAVANNGIIRTFFKPRDGLRYWQGQVSR